MTRHIRIGPRGTAAWWILSASVVLALAYVGAAVAQEAAKSTEPEYVNSFFLLDPAGSLEPLERQPVGVGAHTRLMGLGGMGVSYEIQKDRSPIRVVAGARIEAVVRLENHDVDPATLVLLYPLKVDKGKRQLLITGVGFMGSRSKSDLQSKQLEMSFTKYGQASLKITPTAPLAPGEYAFAIQSKDQQPTAYCFGVDAAAR